MERVAGPGSVGAGAGAERVDLASLYAHPAKELPEVPEVPEGVELPEGAPEVPEALEALVTAEHPGARSARCGRH